MSDTFVIAAKLRLSKKAVSTWLRDGFTSENVISNCDQLFEGWYWDGKKPTNFDSVPKFKLIKHRFAQIADSSVSNESESVVAYYDGKKKAVYIYHMMIGFNEADALATLLAIGSASRHRDAKTPDYALLFSETSGRLAPENTIGVLEIKNGAAQFVSTAKPKQIAAALGPAEATFFAALERGIADAMTDNLFLHPQIRQVTKSPRLKKKKRQLPIFETPQAVLDAIADIVLDPVGEPDDVPWHYTDYYDFKREMMHYAKQAANFGEEISEDLLKLMPAATWETLVVCLWGLNQISLSSHNPSYYKKAIELFASSKHRGQGWLRDDRDTIIDDHAALAGNHSLVPGLVKHLRECLELKKKGATTLEEYQLCDLLFHEHGAINELLELHREYYHGKNTLDPHHRDIKLLKKHPKVKDMVYPRFFEPDDPSDDFLLFFGGNPVI